MRRVSSNQQNRINAVAVGIPEQCMQRQSPRSSSVARATPGFHRAPNWFLLLAATLLGFSFLFVLWTYLPPSTVLGVTAQAQAQQHQHAQEPRAQSRGDPLPGAGSAAPDPRPVLSAGSSLSRQAQQQLQQRKEQRHRTSPSSGNGRGNFRGSSTPHVASSSSSSLSNSTAAMSSSTAAQQTAPVAVPASARVIVVGGGLAGLTAALQAAECLALAAAGGDDGGGGSCPATHCPGSGSAVTATSATSAPEVDVLLVEKMPKLGGNSAKASSGMNTLNVAAGDSEARFTEDVLSSGGGASDPRLVAQLVRSSPEALQFLAARGVTLAGVTRLGGHAVPRTRTVTGGANVGWVIMAALTEAVKENPRIRVLEGVTLRRILTASITPNGNDSNAGASPRSRIAVTGVELAAGDPDGSTPLIGTEAVSCSALVLATGGFAANRDLLKAVAPFAADLATTNGPWAQGDALQLATAAGAALVGMSDVQVHPTGFVDPGDPGASTKFLAPEKLRGVGGLLLDSKGHRFVDELARRDVVSGAMMDLKPDRTAWLLLGRDAGAEYGSGALDFYCKKGLMKKAETLAGAAAILRIPEDRLLAELMAYGSTAAAANDSASGGAAADPYGKRVFPHPPDPDSQLPLYIARVTPVVHYTMGGVAINDRAEVLQEGGGGEVIRGLYAAGEVSGGLHGRNRLGGNSLLECAVFGRIAGAQAARCSK